MGLYPYNFKIGQLIATDVPGVSADASFNAHIIIAALSATVEDTAGIHAAIVDTGVQQVVTTGITQPSIPRNITATFGGTATDIKAIVVVITGINYAGVVITENLPAATVNTAGSVAGSKAFKTITSITVPAHDGLGATTAIGFGEALGLPYLLPFNTVDKVFFDSVLETTPATVTTSLTAIESNTIDLNSALNSKVLDIYLMV